MPRIPHTTSVIVLAAAAVVAAAMAGARAADTGCIDDWSVAAPIVKAEGLVSVEQLSAEARTKLKGDIVKTTLCQERGGYVFRLVVRGAGGQHRSVTVDAKRPFGR